MSAPKWPITFVLDGIRRRGVPLTSNQLHGILIFIKAYNRKHRLPDVTSDVELSSYEQNYPTSLFRLYYEESSLPPSGKRLDWLEYDESSFSHNKYTLITDTIRFDDLEPDEIQGFLMGAQWLGENWSNYGQIYQYAPQG